MTAASSPPPRDREVCAALVAELDTFLGQWRTVGAIPFELAGIVDRYRPVAPSEPAAADSPTPGTETCACGHDRSEHDNSSADCGANEWCNCAAFHLAASRTTPGAPHHPDCRDDGCWGTARTCPEPPAANTTDDGEVVGDPGPCLLCTMVGGRSYCGGRTDGCPTFGTPGRSWPAPSPVDTTEPPAETQQDDERVTRGVARALWTQRLAHDPSVRERTAFLAGWDAALAARPSADTETLRGALAQLERLAGDECGPLRMVVLDAVESVRAALDAR